MSLKVELESLSFPRTHLLLIISGFFPGHTRTQRTVHILFYKQRDLPAEPQIFENHGNLTIRKLILNLKYEWKLLSILPKFPHFSIKSSKYVHSNLKPHFGQSRKQLEASTQIFWHI